MRDPSLRNPAYQPLTDQQLAEIDALCDRFDRELVDGQGPRIETFLADAPQAAQDGLLAELLAMELEYRTQQGDHPERNEYVRRFSQRESVIDDVFGAAVTTQFPGDRTISSLADARPDVGNFRLIEEIGRGGMGVVWQAEQHEPVKRRVALKLIKSELTSKNVIARFDAEKQALAIMDHPNIARVLDAGTTDDARPYFVMELVDGIPITQFCDHNKLSVDERLKLFVPVCKAVQHAHQKGIIHRDLKPSNVLVTVIDGEAVPKVIDFGLAKAVDHHLPLTDATMHTEFGKVVGTVQYMSPEQAALKREDAEDVDTRTDVYSLGVMLYELLTGSTPLDEETLAQHALLKVLEIIREEDPPRPSNRLSSSSHDANSEVGNLRRLHPARLQQLLKGELDWVVMKALEKEPDRRYQTANDLGKDLSNYLTGETVTARPPSTWYQLQKFARRNRGLVAAVLAIGVALLAGIAGTTYGLIRANEKADEADGQRMLAVNKSDEAEEQRAIAVENEQLAILEKNRARSNEQRALTAEQRAHDSEAAAKFQLANARWDAGRTRRARELLGEIAPEHRGTFEWNYCIRKFNGSDLTCYGVGGVIKGVAFSPDGARVATGDIDGRLKLWDAQTGQELASLPGHLGPADEVVFSPDGTLLAAAGGGATVSIWESTTGERVATLEGHRNAIVGIGFSANGEQLLSVSRRATVKRWDTRSGQEIATLPGNEMVEDVSFSPDMARFAFCTRSGITVRETSSGRNISTQPNAINWATSVAISPDGMHVAVASHDTLELWTDDLARKRWTGFAKAGWIRDLQFSPDGTRIVSAGESEGHIQVWDVSSGSKVMPLIGHSGAVYGLDFSPGGARLASVSGETTLRLWDVRSGQKAISIRAHDQIVFGLAYSRDDTRLASFAADGVVKLWDVNTCLETARIQVMNAGSYSRPPSTRCVAFSPNDAYIAVVGADNTVKLLDGKTGMERKTFAGHTHLVNGVSFSPEGKWLVSAGQDHDVKVWDVDSGAEVSTLSGHTGPVVSVAFSPDGKHIASASEDVTVRLWDTQSFQQIHSLKHHQSQVLTVTFSPDGKRLVSSGNDPLIYTWDVKSGKPVSQMRGQDGGIVGVEFSPDGGRLASTGYDRSVKLWDTEAARELCSVNTLAGGTGNGTSSAPRRYHGLAFSSDGLQIAVGSDNGIIHFLDAPKEYETLTLSGHRQGISELSFSEDGRRIYSAANDEKLVWDLATKTRIPDAVWDPPAAPSQLSPDNRWLIYSEFNRLILADREYRNTPAEQRYRTLKARFDPIWHQEQATAALSEKNWYAAVFQFALLAKHAPDEAPFYEALLSSFQKLQSQYEQDDRDLEPHFAMVARESLRHADRWAKSITRLTPADIEGEYEFTPRSNDWHTGRITVVSAEEGKLKWTNNAGVSWGLTFDVENGLLKTGPDNPYYDSDVDGNRVFRLMIERDPDSGEWMANVIGFQFGPARFYRKP